MFGRDRSPDETRRSNVQTLPTPGTREAIPVPVGGGPYSQDVPRAADETIIAREDRFEGTLTSQRGVRVQGTVEGKIEAAQYVHIEPNAKVSADISAEEVIIAGTYTGNLVCRQRLEIRETGRVSGAIETVKLMLHEGGYVDGELHMQKPNGASQSSASSTARSGESERARASTEPRSAASASEATSATVD
jgi:cytoskeletal protein CcmA (bactofilin family)